MNNKKLILLSLLGLIGFISYDLNELFLQEWHAYNYNDQLTTTRDQFIIAYHILCLVAVIISLIIPTKTFKHKLCFSCFALVFLIYLSIYMAGLLDTFYYNPEQSQYYFIQIQTAFVCCLFIMTATIKISFSSDSLRKNLLVLGISMIISWLLHFVLGSSSLIQISHLWIIILISLIVIIMLTAYDNDLNISLKVNPLLSPFILAIVVIYLGISGIIQSINIDELSARNHRLQELAEQKIQTAFDLEEELFECRNISITSKDSLFKEPNSHQYIEE